MIKKFIRYVKAKFTYDGNSIIQSIRNNLLENADFSRVNGKYIYEKSSPKSEKNKEIKEPINV